MRFSTVFEKENSLPGAELHFSISNRHGFTRARQDHANVRGHVVRAFVVVFVVCIFRHQLVEEPFHIAACSRCCILHRGQATTRVLEENGHDSVSHTRFGDLVLKVIGNFVSSLAICADLEFFVLHLHGQKISIWLRKSRVLIFTRSMA